MDHKRTKRLNELNFNISLTGIVTHFMIRKKVFIDFKGPGCKARYEACAKILSMLLMDDIVYIK